MLGGKTTLTQGNELFCAFERFSAQILVLRCNEYMRLSHYIILDPCTVIDII